MFKKTSDKGKHIYMLFIFILDPLKIKIDLQKSLLQRKVYDKPLNGVGTTKISHSHSVSSYHLPKNQSPNVNNFFPGTERNIKPIIHNNININVHNLYVTNEKLEHYLHYAKDYQKIGMNGLALGSSTKVKTNNIGLIKVKNLFSKIGSDIISKSQSVKKLNINNNPIKYRLKQPVPKYNNFPSHNNSNSVINNSQINESNPNIKGNKRLRIDLTEQNKDVEFNNSINSSSLLIDKEKDLSFINKSSIKETYIKVNDNTIQANSKLWEMFFELELNLESKLYLTSSLNKLLFFLHNEFLGIKINIDLDIFNLSILSTQYKKLMKLSIICLMYIKFLLNDFNFEMALKIAVKNLLYNFNDALLLLLKQVIFIGEDSMKLTDNPKCSLIGNESVAFYMKLTKIHKIKKLNESINTFNITLLKKVEGIVLLLKQFTNNYFKNGYFRPIHSISIELLKQIDTYNIEHIIKIIENGVLFYLMNSNLSNSKNNNDENNIVTQTASGFHPNGAIPVSVPSFPYLPPLDRKKDVYTLVLDLDETLVHYYYVSNIIFNIIFLYIDS